MRQAGGFIDACTLLVLGRGFLNTKTSSLKVIDSLGPNDMLVIVASFPRMVSQSLRTAPNLLQDRYAKTHPYAASIGHQHHKKARRQSK